jgi:hypothetical protein
MGTPAQQKEFFNHGWDEMDMDLMLRRIFFIAVGGKNFSEPNAFCLLSF